MEFGVVTLLYVGEAIERRVAAGATLDFATLHAAIEEGAVQRMRPNTMTIALTRAGLALIMGPAVRAPRPCSGSPRRCSAA